MSNPTARRWRPSADTGLRPPPDRVHRDLLRAAAAVLVLAIFLVDTLSTLEGAVAVLYVVAVLMVARTGRRGDVIAVATAGMALTVAAYFGTHGLRHVGAPTVRAVVSLAAIGISAMLALQNLRSLQALSSQAMLLDLSHDMIFVRDRHGRITYWNRTAQALYGWTPAEAIGQVADDLLQTCYPEHREAIEARLLADGRWEGTLEQRARDGRKLLVESRWVLQRDAAARPRGVLETHTDITARQAAHAALVDSERRYRRMFDATRIGIVQLDWSAVRRWLDALGLADPAALAAHLQRHPEFAAQARALVQIDRINPAFATITGIAAGAPALGSLDELLDDGDATFGPSLLSFIAGEPFFEGETEVVHRDGHRVPVLFTITFPDAGESDGNVLVFVVDISERRLAEDAARKAQAELAHALRVATLGELTASIAHEVNQPLMAVVTNGEAGMRWLQRAEPDLHEVGTAMSRIIAEGRRASGIVKRLRDFLSKAEVRHDDLEVPSLVADAIELVRHEFSREGIDWRVSVQPGLPRLRGDRLQLEQVLVNLMLNASQAMAGQPAPRRLQVSAESTPDGRLAIAVTDNGPGIAAEDQPRLFEPFFSTKSQGMGMGLAICRTTAEAHGGQLTMESAPGRGSVFRIILAAHHAA